MLTCSFKIMKLNNKNIWITGASSGIGREAAIQLAQKGCSLILSSRNLENLKTTQTACLQHTEQVHILALDLEKTDELKQKTIEAISVFNRIDGVLLSGGISQRSLILETDIKVDRKLMEVDYLGNVAIAKALLPHFIENRSGLFIVISSVMGKFGSPYRSGYCGAKHALHGFFDVLRMEHEKDDVQVCIICPGFVNTDVTRNAITGDGSTYNRQDQKTEEGLRVENFTKKMIRAVERNQFEAYIGRKEALAVYIKRFFPRLLHKIVLKSRVR